MLAGHPVYVMVTQNAKMISKFSTFVGFLGSFLKKQCFSKTSNFEIDENFELKLTAKLPHKLSWKMNVKCLGLTPHLMPAMPIFDIFVSCWQTKGF